VNVAQLAPGSEHYLHAQFSTKSNKCRSNREKMPFRISGFGALRLCHADSQWSGLGPGTSLDSSSPNLASTSDSSEHTLGKWEVFTSACGFHLGFNEKNTDMGNSQVNI